MTKIKTYKIYTNILFVLFIFKNTGLHALCKGSMSSANSLRSHGDRLMRQLVLDEKRKGTELTRKRQSHRIKRMTQKWTGCIGYLRYKWDKWRYKSVARESMRASHRQNKVSFAELQLHDLWDEPADSDGDDDDDDDLYIRDVMNIAPSVPA